MKWLSQHARWAGTAPQFQRLEVAVSGRRDLNRHVAAGEFEVVVGADAAALQVGTEEGSAGGALPRRMLDFPLTTIG